MPLAPEIALGSDRGEPVVCAHPDSAVSVAFAPLIEAVAALGRKDFSSAVAATLGDVFQGNLADPELNHALAHLPDEAREALGDKIAALLGQESVRLKDVVRGKDTP